MFEGKLEVLGCEVKPAKFVSVNLSQAIMVTIFKIACVQRNGKASAQSEQIGLYTAKLWLVAKRAAQP
jgi:hypothetical protein